MKEKSKKTIEDFIEGPKSILWIYGKSGYGKTALARHIIGRFREKDKETYSLDAKDFKETFNDYVKYNRDKDVLIGQCQNYDLMLFDNVDLSFHRLKYNQQEFKYIISEIIKNKKTKIILISNKRPRRLKPLKFSTEDCHYLHLKSPSMDLKIKLLKDLARRRKTKIPEQTIACIALIADDLFQLQGEFNKLCLLSEKK